MSTLLDSRRLSSLDGLRGVAALAVVLLHGTEIFRQRWTPHQAYLAVDFFFLLSGYVLARAFDRRLAAGWVAGFLTRRFVRLYPLVAAGSLLGFVMLSCSSLVGRSIPMTQAALDFVCSLLLIPTPPLVSPGWRMYMADPPLWSLFYEAAANLVFALVAPVLTSGRLAILVAASGVALAVAIAVVGDANFALDHFELGGLRVLFSFFLGVAMHRLEGSRPAAGRLPAGALVIVAAALSAVLLVSARTGALYAFAAIYVVFPALLWLALQVRPVGGRLGRLMLALGLVSYPVYVIHHPLFRLISGLGFRGGAEGVRLAGLVFGMALAVVLSWLLARVYDEPVRNWLGRRLGPGRRPVATAGPATVAG